MVMLTHNRLEYAKRAVRYYEGFGFDILVADSSDVSAERDFKFSCVEYLHCPGVSISQKIELALDKIKSEFFVFLSDDDFLLKEGLLSSLSFLKENKEFSFCHGWCLFYLPELDRVNYFYRDKLVKTNYDETRIEDRVFSFFDQYIPTFYAVTRTDVARKWFAKDAGCMGFEYHEFSYAMFLLLAGKGKILHVPYVVRESNYITSEHGTDMLTMLSGKSEASHSKKKTCVSFMRPLVAEYIEGGEVQAARFIENCIGLVVDCLSTGRSLTLQHIFTSSWSFGGAKPVWSFEPRQFLEMPFYTEEFFACLSGIDFLLRVYPVGKLQKIQAKERFSKRNKILLDFQKNPVKQKLDEFFTVFLEYPFDFEMNQLVKRHVLQTDLIDFIKNKSSLIDWVEKVDNAFNYSNFSLPGRDEYVYPSQRDVAAAHTANIDTWLQSRTIDQKVKEQLGLSVVSIKAYVVCEQTGDSANMVVPVVAEGLDVSYVVTREQYLAGIVPVEKAVVQEGESLVQCLNQQIEHSSCEWILFLAGDAEVVHSGLLMAQIELSKNPALSAISFDAVYRQEDGSLGAALKPSTNLDYLLSFPAGSSRNWVFNRQALLDIGGFNPDLPDAFELDAILRLVNQHGLDKLGHIPEPLVITQPPVLANVDDERIAIENHLRERGYENAQVHAPNPGRYQIRYNHPQQPVVSVLLAAGKDLTKLQRCVEGLLGSTAYQTFEILFIEQPDSSKEVKQWLAELAALQEPKLRIHKSRKKTLSDQYNEAHSLAIGDYLLFLSADTAVISEHWLDEMLNHAQRGEVGVVGAKLLTAEGKIAHAGHILGLHGPVGSPFVGEPMEEPGYMQRLQVDQNLSAVGGDCMMVLKQLFVELDGFDSSGLADEYLSTDFCLRSSAAGFLTVCTPHAQLMLDRDSRSAPDNAKQDLMYDKWLPQLARDPAYNPNFSLSMPGGFKLADSQISWRPLDDMRPAPVALVHPADLFGCGHYRVMQPFLAMKEAGLLDGAISTGLMHVTDLERYNPDTIVLQRQIGDERLEAMRRMQRFSRAVKVYELDDYLPNLPLKSVHRKDMPKDILKSLRRGLGFVDRFVVSTPALAEAFSGLHGEILVRENRLPTRWWGGLQTLRRQGKKPRVGWAGGSSHTGDLELIADVVRDLADEVEWVFFGMCPEALKPYVHEFHGGVAIEQYPAKLASLNLDLGLAPLEHNLFNECKSHLRQLEYGVCGIPIICTDIRPYQEGLQAGLPVTLVKNRYRDWVEAIRMHINDLDATAKMADELQAKVLSDWMLQGQHLEHWRDAWLGK